MYKYKIADWFVSNGEWAAAIPIKAENYATVIGFSASIGTIFQLDISFSNRKNESCMEIE